MPAETPLAAAPLAAAPLEAPPAPATTTVTTGTCDEAAFIQNTDLYGGDIVSSDSFRDTVVASTSPLDCCQQCQAYSGCYAWTMTLGTVNCGGRLGDEPDDVNCCYLKLASGWVETYRAGWVSGKFATSSGTAGSPSPPAVTSGEPIYGYTFNNRKMQK